MSPALIPARRPVALVRPAAPAESEPVPVHWAASPCVEPGRVTGQPGEVTCPACVAWQVEQAWTIRHTRTGVAA